MPDRTGERIERLLQASAPGNKLPGFHHGLINPCIGNIMFNKGRDPDAVIIFPLAKGKSIKSQKGEKVQGSGGVNGSHKCFSRSMRPSRVKVTPSASNSIRCSPGAKR